MGAEPTPPPEPEPADCKCGHADWLHTAYLEDDPGPLAACDVGGCPCVKFEEVPRA